MVGAGVAVGAAGVASAPDPASTAVTAVGVAISGAALRPPHADSSTSTTTGNRKRTNVGIVIFGDNFCTICLAIGWIE
jgi:hypothetical protein